MRAIAEHGVGLTLTVFVKRRGRRIESFLHLGNEAGLICERVLNFTRRSPPAPSMRMVRPLKMDGCLVADIGEPQDRAAHRPTGQKSGLAGNKSLTRCRRLAAVGRRVRVR